MVDKIPLVFVCNKSDLVGDASSELEAARELSSRHNVGLEGALPAGFSACLATSAKTGSNVEAVFETLGHLLLSEKKPEDPLKELCESLFSESIQRKTDRSTLVGVTDVLIVDFCKGFGDEGKAMNALRKQFIRAGLDARNPSRDALFRAVEYMAEAESGSHDEPAVRANRERRMRLVESAGSRTAALERPDGTAKVSR